MSSVIGNCPLCEEHSLHIIGEDKLETQQCINCGYVTAEKFKLNGLSKEEHTEYSTLTEDMKRWTMESNDRLWIPTILTLPIGMLYPEDVDNMVNHKSEMKWKFAEMVEIPEDERKNYPVEGSADKFYERKIDVDNAKVYDTFLEGMSIVNKIMKEKSTPEEKSIKLPKLKKVKK